MARQLRNLKEILGRYISHIINVDMIYLDTVANLMHDKFIFERPMRVLFARSNKIRGYNTRHAAKGNYLRKEAKLENFKHSFSRTGAILWIQISPDRRDIYLKQS